MTTKAELIAELDYLKRDRAFGILTRPGLELEHRKTTEATYVIFIDLDQIHSLNELLGHDTVNRMIRTAIRIRHQDLLLSGRWYSGDELVFLVRGNPQAIANRLQASLIKNGLSGTIAYARLSRNLERSVAVAKRKVDIAKKANNRGAVVR